MPISFAEVLGRFIQREHTSINRLATLSKVPKKTITNWLEGKVRRPRQWQDLLMVAGVLHLSEADTNTLLVAAGYSILSDLRARFAADAERRLLDTWAPATTVPFQAIARLSYFVGRHSELRQLTRAVLKGHYVTICNLHGMGGVGKTALAAHLAYQLRPHFPDGVLWARLDTSDTLTILSAFAAAYGHDVGQQTDVESRGGAVRSLLADKRVLIVLDNAQTSAQVRPLLPPSTGRPAVIITTRHDLEVADGWARLAVEPFDPESGDAFSLFEKLMGTQRARRQRAAISTIGELLGQLPLALALVASRLVAQPDQAIADFVERLRCDEARLNALEREDRSVRLSFDLSYEALNSELQLFFAALGVFGGEDFGVGAVAYVTETSTDLASSYLDQLAKLSLIQPSRSGRYRMHPLLRDYARSRAQQTQQYARRLDRVLHFLIQAARQATQPSELAGDMSNLNSALREAYEHDLAERAAEAVAAFQDIWLNHGSYALVREQITQALEVAAGLPDKQIQVRLLLGLGTSEISLGDWQSGQARLTQALALAHTHAQQREVADALRAQGKLAYEQGNWLQSSQAHQQSLSIARQIGDQDLIGRNLNNLGLIALAQSDYASAETLLLEAQDVFRRAELPMAESVVLVNLGQIYQARGDLTRAEECYRTGLGIARMANSQPSMIFMSINITDILLERNQLAEAEALMREAVAIAHDIHLRRDEGMALGALGQVLGRQGKFTEATTCAQNGLTIAQAVQDRESEARARIILGGLFFRQRHFEQAEAEWREAVDLARQLHNQLLQAEGCFHLAQLAKAQQSFIEAGQLAQDSLTLYRGIQHYKATQVSEWLTVLSQEPFYKTLLGSSEFNGAS